MPHYYIEYVEPKPGVSQARFQEVVGRANEQWAEAHPDDRLVFTIGRTWRLGPRPGPYLTIWEMKDLRTLHEWDEEFRKPAILEQHGEFTEVATIVDAGVYATLGEEVW